METICAASCRQPTRIEEARSSPSRPSARTARLAFCLYPAHEVGDGQGQDAVEDVDPDFLVGPVEHWGEAHDVGVFELPET